VPKTDLYQAEKAKYLKVLSSGRIAQVERENLFLDSNGQRGTEFEDICRVPLLGHTPTSARGVVMTLKYY
jgi:hypothetical protein